MADEVPFSFRCVQASGAPSSRAEVSPSESTLGAVVGTDNDPSEETHGQRFPQRTWK